VQAARKALGDESLWLLQSFYISIEEASPCRILFLNLIISKNTYEYNLNQSAALMLSRH
jgi:hypothetical protein